MQKPQFEEGEIYHIYNRGVEKRRTFLNDRDYLRFVNNLFEFNDQNPVVNNSYYSKSFESIESTEVQPRHLSLSKPKKSLVEVLVFTLMPNHFHLLLKQKTKNGIIKFMQKLGTGYSMYFNKKYNRVGSLFQGRFKAVLVSKDSHFIHLPFYIHCNPLELFKSKSNRGSTLISPIKFLENYRWSSFQDYIGKNNFPMITSRETILEFFGGEKEYKKATIEWLEERKENLGKINDMILESSSIESSSIEVEP